MRLRTILEQNLRLLCHERGLSVERLAELSGISDSYCWRILRQRAGIGLDRLEMLAAGLGVPASRLLEEIPADTVMPPPLRRGRKKKPA